LKQVVGANYYGPVPEILAEDPDRTKHARMFILSLPPRWCPFDVLDSGYWLWFSFMVTMPPFPGAEADRLARVSEMATEFPHVKFTGVDICQWLFLQEYSSLLTWLQIWTIMVSSLPT
jgi:hypothetical protein